MSLETNQLIRALEADNYRCDLLKELLYRDLRGEARKQIQNEQIKLQRIQVTLSKLELNLTEEETVHVEPN